MVFDDVLLTWHCAEVNICEIYAGKEIYIDIWISRATFWPRPIRPGPSGETASGAKKLEFILDVIRKLTRGKLKVQTYYAMSDLTYL